MKKYRIEITQENCSLDGKKQIVILNNRSKSETIKIISSIYDLLDEKDYKFEIVEHGTYKCYTAKDFLLEI